MRQTSLNMVFELAKHDPRVVFIGSDLGAGVLDDMRRTMPDRFFMEGVCEGNIIGMAAGLAMEGYIPYVNTIATFLTRRCYEQVAIDLCAHNLPVRLIASGGGVVYAPLGPTHLAIEDIAIMRALPNMTVIAPADAEEMTRLMGRTLDWPGPMYIRLGKGGDPVVSSEAARFDVGKAIMMRPTGRILAVTTGVMTARVLEAADLLAQRGVSMGVLHCHTIKPLDDALIVAAARDVDLVVTIEEHSAVGGLGSAVADALALARVLKPALRLSLPDAFFKDYGSQDHLLRLARLTPPQIAEDITVALSGEVGGAQ